jgi:hypothetical protein
LGTKHRAPALFSCELKLGAEMLFQQKPQTSDLPNAFLVLALVGSIMLIWGLLLLMR